MALKLFALFAKSPFHGPPCQGRSDPFAVDTQEGTGCEARGREMRTRRARAERYSNVVGGEEENEDRSSRDAALSTVLKTPIGYPSDA